MGTMEFTFVCYIMVQQSICFSLNEAIPRYVTDWQGVDSLMLSDTQLLPHDSIHSVPCSFCIHCRSLLKCHTKNHGAVINYRGWETGQPTHCHSALQKELKRAVSVTPSASDGLWWRQGRTYKEAVKEGGKEKEALQSSSLGDLPVTILITE